MLFCTRSDPSSVTLLLACRAMMEEAEKSQVGHVHETGLFSNISSGFIIVYLFILYIYTHLFLIFLTWHGFDGFDGSHILPIFHGRNVSGRNKLIFMPWSQASSALKLWLYTGRLAMCAVFRTPYTNPIHQKRLVKWRVGHWLPFSVQRGSGQENLPPPGGPLSDLQILILQSESEGKTKLVTTDQLNVTLEGAHLIVHTQGMLAENKKSRITFASIRITDINAYLRQKAMYSNCFERWDLPYRAGHTGLDGMRFVYYPEQPEVVGMAQKPSLEPTYSYWGIIRCHRKLLIKALFKHFGNVLNTNKC